MPHSTCSIERCERPQYQGRRMCASHFMRQYRYGDPHHRPQTYIDIVGQRYGLLVVERREGRAWVCRCDCGATATISVGNINRGQTTCGDRSAHRRSAEVGYWGVHQRLEADRGKASSHPCADCGARAAHWSYNNAGADERRDARSGLAYSVDQGNYDPRCIRCHARFDARAA